MNFFLRRTIKSLGFILFGFLATEVKAATSLKKEVWEVNAHLNSSFSYDFKDESLSSSFLQNKWGLLTLQRLTLRSVDVEGGNLLIKNQYEDFVKGYSCWHLFVYNSYIFQGFKFFNKSDNR